MNNLSAPYGEFEGEGKGKGEGEEGRGRWKKVSSKILELVSVPVSPTPDCFSFPRKFFFSPKTCVRGPARGLGGGRGRGRGFSVFFVFFIFFIFFLSFQNILV